MATHHPSRGLSLLRKSLVLLVALLAMPASVFAHPLDISASFFTIQDTRVAVSTFFHPFEIEHLLASRLQGGARYDLQRYFDYPDVIFDYVAQHSTLTTGGVACVFARDEIPHREDYELLSGGLEVRYSFTCPQTIQALTLDLRFFTDDFPLQTNRLTIYDTTGSPTTTNAAAKKILTTTITQFTWQRGAVPTQLQDTDGDSISDIEERSYRTDPARADTDGDGYSDGEEIMSGWDPLSRTLSPGQKPATIDNPLEGHIFAAMWNGFFGGGGGSGGTQSDVFATGPLKRVLAELTHFFAAPTMAGLALILAVMYLLGLFHAMSVGHGKTMLASYLVDGERTIWQGIRFAAVLTMTHLADVILLGVVFKLFSGFSFAAAWTEYLQVIAVVGLVLLSLYVLIRAIRGFAVCRLGDTTAAATQRPTLMMAFLLGLAPCTFGWAIFLVLLSLGKVAWVLPLLGAFGLGIFSCLLLVVVVVGVLRMQATRRFTWVARVAPLVSGGLLFMFSLRIAYQFIAGTMVI